MCALRRYASSHARHHPRTDEEKDRNPEGRKEKTSAKASGKRELIAPNGDKRYVPREKTKANVEVSRSLAQDLRKHGKTKAKPGQGDRGDHG